MSVVNQTSMEDGVKSNESKRIVPVSLPEDKAGEEVEEGIPIFTAISTYIGYLILILFGHIRDFFGKRLLPDRYKHLREQNVKARIVSQFFVGLRSVDQ